MRDESGKKLFTCKECGAHRLKVILRYRTASITQESMECTCNKGAVAATRRTRHVNTWEEQFDLEGDHSWSERIGNPTNVDTSKEEMEIDVACQKCFEGGEWPGEDDDLTEEPIEEQRSREHWVRCRGCDREIRFAWSSSEISYGESPIWPVECTDYDPATTRLDPRYKDESKD